MSRRARYAYAIVIGLTLVAAVWTRVQMLRTGVGFPDSDETVVGLMAQSIRHGEHPVFFWGQAYGGTIEPLLTAALFSVFGISRWTLKAVPIGLSVVVAFFLWRVGRRTIDEPPALFAAALSLVFPAFFLWWSTKALDYYEIAPLLCVLALFFALRLRARFSLIEVAALGFVSGLAFWTSPQTGFVIAPVVVWLAIRTRSSWKSWWPAPLAFLAGALPWLWWNAHHDWQSLELPKGIRHSTYLGRLRIFFTHTLPMALGFRVPYRTDIWHFGALGKVLYIVALVAFVVAVVFAVRRDRRLEPLVVVAAAFPFMFAIPATSAFKGEPRYSAMLVPVLLLLIVYFLRRPWMQFVALGVACASAGATLYFLENSPNVEIRGPDVAPVVKVLDDAHTNGVYADYWLAYPIDFATKERIKATPVDTVRDGKIDAAVAPVTPSYYVLFRGGTRDRALGPALDALGVSYKRTVAGPRFVVYQLDRNFRPDALPPGFWRTHGT
jgi:4-amino-4-deoxy-L-arabinose transferase-like glycosyltransferase